MARYLVHIDMAPAIALALSCADGDNLEMEEFVGVPQWWTKTGEQTVDGVRRLYYAACAPYRCLLVMRTGADIRTLNLAPAASVFVGWDEGTHGYVRPGEEGRRHTKISVDTTYTLQPDQDPATLAAKYNMELIAWSDLLRKVPRSDQRGGYRGTQGRQRIDQDEPTQRINASVPASYVAAVKRLGAGDISAGVRKAIETAAAPRSETITIASRKVAEHQVDPALVEIGGRTWVDMGTGLLAEVLAASVESGAIAGEVLRQGDAIYYYHAAGYDSLTIMVMLRP